MANLFKHRIQFEYFRFLIRKHSRYLFLITLLMVVMNPLMIFTFNARSQISATTLLSGQVFITSITLVTAFVVPMVLFSFLSNKQSIDVFLSLPIKKKDLYITLYYTGIFMILLPYLIGWSSGLIINLFTGIHIGRTLGYFIISLLPLLTVYSLVLYVILNTANLLHTIFYSFFIQFLPLLVYYAIFFFWDTSFLGFHFALDWNILRLLSPIVNLYYNFTLQNSSLLPHILGIIWLISLYFLNRHFFLQRKAEHAGKSFTNSFFFPLINGITIISIQLFAYAMILDSHPSDSLFSIRSLLFPFLISLLIYLLLDIIMRVSLRNTLSATLHYLLIGLLVFAVLLPLRYTNGLGFITKVPKDVDSITFIVKDSANILLPNQDSIYLNTSDEKDIQEIQTFHQYIITEMKSYQYSQSLLQLTLREQPTTISSDYPYFDIKDDHLIYVEFQYHSNNQTMIRSYYIPMQWTYGILQLQDKPSYFEAHYAYLEEENLATIYLLDPFQTEAIDITKKISTTELKELLHRDFNNLDFLQRLDTSYQVIAYIQYQYCSSSSDTLNRMNSCVQKLIPITDKDVNLTNYFYHNDIHIPKSEPSEKAILIFPDSKDSRRDYFHFLNHTHSINTLLKIGQDLDTESNLLINYTYLTDEQQLLMQEHLAPYGMTKNATVLVILGNNDLFDYDNMVLMVREDSLELVLNLIAGNDIYIAETIEDFYSIDNKQTP